MVLRFRKSHSPLLSCTTGPLAGEKRGDRTRCFPRYSGMRRSLFIVLMLAAAMSPAQARQWHWHWGHHSGAYPGGAYGMAPADPAERRRQREPGLADLVPPG